MSGECPSPSPTNGDFTHTLTNLLTLEDVITLAPDIFEAIDVPCPADTMSANEIRMAGFRTYRS